MNKSLENYLKIIFPQPLETNEYIRLMLQFAKAGNAAVSIKYVKTFEKVQEIVGKYKYTHNIFISLSTYFATDSDGNMAEPYRRQVVFLDFDSKDYPEFKDVKDFSAHIKGCMPSLFNHCIVASGSGGYHYYIATEVSTPDKLSAINKKIARLTGADEKATLPTQLARLPTSYNLKNPDDKKYVNIVNNVYDTEQFRPYSISTLKSLANFTERNNKLDIPEQEKPIETEIIKGKYYCIEKMINSGCEKGERNFALGRITAYLKRENYTYHKAKEVILDWNKRCSPPKSIREIESEFDSYWNTDKYNLLGCNLPDGRNKEILEKYCDRTLCKSFQTYEYAGNFERVIFINSKLLDKRNIRRLTGNHYLVLFLLIDFKELTEKDLSQKISHPISDRKLKSILKDLLEYKIVNKSITGIFTLKKINSNYSKDIMLYRTGLDAFISERITQKEFIIYLTINTLLQTRNNSTYESLSDYMNIEKSSVSKYVNSLNKKGILKITKTPNDKGLLCNRYVFI